MARTQKDTPLWVVLNRQENIVGYRHQCGSRFGLARECDLNEEHDRNAYRLCRPVLASNVHWKYDACWGWKRPRRGGREGFGHDRAELRDALRELEKNHRGGHDTDDSHLVNQQRRHTIYGWWAD